MLKKSSFVAIVAGASVGVSARAADEIWPDCFTQLQLDKLLTKTNLTGAGVKVGMIEPDLPLHDHVMLAGQVTARGDYTKEEKHATAVASLLVGKRLHPGLPYRGVAPGAKLYAAWMGPDSLRPKTDQDFLNVFKGAVDWQIAQKTTIVNVSWGTTKNASAAARDATDRIADWYVNKSNALMVVGAGNDGKIEGDGGNFTGNIISPARAYNVLAVGMVNALNKIDPESSVGQAGKRVKPDLVCRGTGIEAATMVGNSKEAATDDWKGTSFAAPLVAGTAALLQQYGAKSPAFDATVRDDPRLMRAVLMNSTSKTAQDRTGKRWDELFADGASGKVNMSTELGTGAMDAMQAYQQYAAGQKRPTFGVDQTEKNVGETGWDVRSLAGKGVEKSNDYRTELLRKGTVLASTVCWNVGVTTTDGSGKELGMMDWKYETPAAVVLSISAQGAYDTLLSTSDASETSSQHNVYRVEDRKRYYVRVYHAADSVSDNTRYGLAWRAFEMDTSKVGSFNGGFDGDRGGYRDNGWYAAVGSLAKYEMVTTDWGRMTDPSGSNNAAALGNGSGLLSGISQELVRPLAYFTLDFDLAVSSFDPASAMKIMLGDIDLLSVLGASLNASSLGGVHAFSHFSFSLNSVQLASLSGDFTEISFLASGGNATFYLDNVEYVPAPGATWLLGIGLLATRRRRR